MKRTLLIFTLIALSATVVFGQGREMRRAERQLNRGNLDSALEYITEVMEYESAQEDPEAWMLKAIIYMQIAMAEEEAYRNLVDQPVPLADQALTKAQKLDISGQHILEMQQALLLMSELTFNFAVDAFNSDQFGEASEFFLRSYEINKSFESIDTTTLYNAGIAFELSHQMDRAKEVYDQLYEMNYQDPFLYTSLANISMERGDTIQAINYIQEGRDVYPENLDLIFAEANIYIFTGDLANAEQILDVAISRDPENETLYFAMGANYDQMTQDTLASPEDREFAYKRAQEAYHKALELNPDYFDVIYNLGVLHFNKGLMLLQEAEETLRQTHDFAAYQEEEEAIIEVWGQAQPYLERARELTDEADPHFQGVLLSLVELYARTGQHDKMSKIEELYLKYFGQEE